MGSILHGRGVGIAVAMALLLGAAPAGAKPPRQTAEAAVEAYFQCMATAAERLLETAAFDRAPGPVAEKAAMRCAGEYNAVGRTVRREAPDQDEAGLRLLLIDAIARAFVARGFAENQVVAQGGQMRVLRTAEILPRLQTSTLVFRTPNGSVTIDMADDGTATQVHRARSGQTLQYDGFWMVEADEICFVFPQFREKIVACPLFRVSPSVLQVDAGNGWVEVSLAPGTQTGPAPARPPTVNRPPNNAPGGPPPRQPGGETVAAFGSGFFVARTGEIVTNAHVVNGCRRVVVRQPEGPGEDALLIARDTNRDLALLRVASGRAPAAATIRDGRVIRAGDGVVAVGFPLAPYLSFEANISPGAVTAMNGQGGDHTRLQISAPVQPGNSGGPLLDMAGHVTGVVVSIIDSLGVAQATGAMPQNIAFAIKVDVLRQFLDQHGVRYAREASARDMGAADVGDIARPFVARVECMQ